MAPTGSKGANSPGPARRLRPPLPDFHWGHDMKILITGGGGFIGSHLAEAHLAEGDEVWALDTGMNLKVRHLLSHPAFHYVKASVTDAEALEAFILRCDLVYHHAAVVGVEHYVDDP